MTLCVKISVLCKDLTDFSPVLAVTDGLSCFSLVLLCLQAYLTL